MNIKRSVPNIITCCNLLSGCIACVMALESHLEMATLWIIIAAVFDFCDGLVARLLRCYSPMGKELDSLGDVVSFGVAPGFMYVSVSNSVTSINVADIDSITFGTVNASSGYVSVIYSGTSATVSIPSALQNVVSSSTSGAHAIHYFSDPILGFPRLCGPRVEIWNMMTWFIPLYVSTE